MMIMSSSTPWRRSVTASTRIWPRTPTPDRRSRFAGALAAAPGLDRVRRRGVAGRRAADHAAAARAQPAAGGRRRAGAGALLVVPRRDRHRRRRQQTEAAHRRALARLDRLRLPDDTPNPYQAKAAPGKRRSTGHVRDTPFLGAPRRPLQCGRY